MTQTFNVIGHPQQAEIIAAIVAGESQRGIAGRFPNLSKSGVDRFQRFYRREHAIEIEAASKEEAKAAIHASGEALYEAIDMARADDDTRALIAGAKTLSDHAITMGKVGGWLKDGIDVNVNVNDQGAMQAMMKFLVAELTPVPGGIEALERALGKIDAAAAAAASESEQPKMIEMQSE